MSPELLAAVKERTDRGYTDEQITHELLTAGYGEEVIQAVIAESRNNHSVVFEHRIPPVQLPTVMELCMRGVAYTKQRLDVLAILAASVVPVFVLEFYDPEHTNQVSNILTLLAVTVNVLITVLVLYVVARDSGSATKTTLSEGFGWIKKNIGGLLWVGILNMVIVFGGLLLLIVPGLILSLYFYFAQYVYINEDARGLSALLRSRQLVYGSAWEVAGKLLGIGSIFLLIFMALSIFFGVLFGESATLAVATLGQHSVTDFLVGLFGQMLGVIFTVVGLHAVAELYQALTRRTPVLPIASADLYKYRLLLVWGMISLVISVGVLVKFISEYEKPMQLPVVTDQVEEFDAKAKATELREGQ